jgi:hypothetical protein
MSTAAIVLSDSKYKEYSLQIHSTFSSPFTTSSYFELHSPRLIWSVFCAEIDAARFMCLNITRPRLSVLEDFLTLILIRAKIPSPIPYQKHASEYCRSVVDPALPDWDDGHAGCERHVICHAQASIC